MAKQSAIQKNNNRKVLIDRLSEKRKKLKSLLSSKDLPFEQRVKIQMNLSLYQGIHQELDIEIDVFYQVDHEEFIVNLIYLELL